MHTTFQPPDGTPVAADPAAQRGGYDVAGIGLAALVGVAYAWLTFQVVLGLVLGIARVGSDAPSYAIVNGSMEPALPVGSVVVNGPVDPNVVLPESALTETAEEYERLRGDNSDEEGRRILSAGSVKMFEVVSFDDPAVANQIVTHRVVDIVDGELITKGDANQNPDSTPVPLANVKGKAQMVIPAVGKPVLWYERGNYMSLVLWIGSVIGSGLVIVSEHSRQRSGNRSSLPIAADLPSDPVTTSVEESTAATTSHHRSEAPSADRCECGRPFPTSRRRPPALPRRHSPSVRCDDTRHATAFDPPLLPISGNNTVDAPSVATTWDHPVAATRSDIDADTTSGWVDFPDDWEPEMRGPVVSVSDEVTR